MTPLGHFCFSYIREGVYYNSHVPVLFYSLNEEYVRFLIYHLVTDAIQFDINTSIHFYFGKQTVVKLYFVCVCEFFSFS